MVGTEPRLRTTLPVGGATRFDIKFTGVVRLKP